MRLLCLFDPKCERNHPFKEYMFKSASKISFLLNIAFFGLFAGLTVVSAVVLYLQPRLPNIDQIRDIQLQVPLRVYSADNLLLGEFGEKKTHPA